MSTCIRCIPRNIGSFFHGTYIASVRDLGERHYISLRRLTSRIIHVPVSGGGSVTVACRAPRRGWAYGPQYHLIYVDWSTRSYHSAVSCQGVQMAGN